mmetsp:Transcript_102174/g.329591  ORF Transcript_102174/g.329591 Transcript_102174/m.329591 type:complete len:204 (+) Transcript_102174:815-1426(+)
MCCCTAETSQCAAREARLWISRSGSALCHSRARLSSLETTISPSTEHAARTRISSATKIIHAARPRLCWCSMEGRRWHTSRTRRFRSVACASSARHGSRSFVTGPSICPGVLRWRRGGSRSPKALLCFCPTAHRSPTALWHRKHRKHGVSVQARPGRPIALGRPGRLRGPAAGGAGPREAEFLRLRAHPRGYRRKLGRRDALH